MTDENERPPVPRDARGRILPGYSLNPLGRQAETSTQKLAALMTEASSVTSMEARKHVAEGLLEIAGDDEATDAARVAAHRALLDMLTAQEAKRPEETIIVSMPSDGQMAALAEQIVARSGTEATEALAEQFVKDAAQMGFTARGGQIAAAYVRGGMEAVSSLRGSWPAPASASVDRAVGQDAREQEAADVEREREARQRRAEAEQEQRRRAAIEQHLADDRARRGLR